MCFSLQIYGVDYDNANQYIKINNRLEHLLSYFVTKNCVYKIDDFAKEKYNIHVTGYRESAKCMVLKVTIIENLEDCFLIATSFLKKVAIEKINNEVFFCLITGPFKTTPQMKSARFYLTS